MNYKLGYIDEDAGQRTTFYHTFKEDYENIKLFRFTDETTIDSLITDIVEAKLDLVVIDYELTADGVIDFDADELIDELLKRYIHFPFIILTSNEDDALDHIHYANRIYSKDNMGDEFFKRIIKNNMEEYSSRITNNKETIQLLTNKKNKEGLSVLEEEDNAVKFPDNFLSKFISII